MVSCKFCKSENTLDSAFCRRCGKPITPREVQRARTKIDADIADGYAALTQGSLEEALAAADAALASDQTSARAWSLRGLCLERRGDLPEALVAFESALKYDHASAADRIKVAQLQQIVAVRELAVPPPDRRLAIGAGLATCLLAIALGAFAATRGGSEQPEKLVASNQPQTSGYSATNFSSPPSRGESATQPEGDDAAPEARELDTPEDQSTPAPRIVNPPSDGVLPRPTFGNGMVGDLSPKPVNPLPQGLEIRPMTPENEDPAQKPTIAMSIDPEPEANDAAPTQEPADSSVVDIKLSEPGSRRTSGGSEPIGANGIEALVRTARGQFQIGNYQAAASSYERALNAGADPAGVNQRLAQCYERLGRQSDAIGAYQRAITAIEKALGSGKGNTEVLRTQLESSKQALRVLQGG